MYLPYKFFNNYILRTPSLPFESIKDNYESEILDDQLLEALYIASPSMYDECIKWLDSIKDNRDYNTDKVILSLHKYIIRMSSRCTPFGLFAGCSVGSFSSETKLIKASNCKRLTRLDMNYLCGLGDQISNISYIKSKLKYFPNNSIYRINEKIRLVVYKYTDNKRIYSIISVDSSDYLEKILLKAREGALLKDLVNEIVGEDVLYEEAEEFINDLVENQIVISELYPNLTGEDYFTVLLKKIKSFDDDLSMVVLLLERIKSLLSNLDIENYSKLRSYEDLIPIVESTKVPYDRKFLLQVDMSHSFEINTLDFVIRDNLHKALNIFNKISFNHKNEELEDFKDKFFKRYESRKIPLLEAIDNEFGVGYGGQGSDSSPFLNNMFFNRSKTKIEYKVDDLDKVILSKVIKARSENKNYIALTDEDILVTGIDENLELPDSLSVMFSIIDKNGTIYVKHCGGPTAGRLLARFTHESSDIELLTEAITSKENTLHSDKVLAEIVHLPEDRIGNILSRKNTRQFEIPFLASSSLDKEFQISCQDLQIYVENNKLKLFSKTLSKEVLPRLNSAHNFSNNSLPVYRFLCAMQSNETKNSFNYEWNSILNMFDFLPRLCYENIIIKPARWKIDNDKLVELLIACKSDKDDLMISFLSKNNIPDYVVFSMGDNELVINLFNKLSRKVLASYIKGNKLVYLNEFLYKEKDFVVSDYLGRGYTNEFIALMYKDSPQQIEINTVDSLKIQEPHKRSFGVNSEWVYFKIYIGYKNADVLLCDYIEPLVDELKSKELISDWFFIRYNDPENHIRLRFKAKNHKTDNGLIITRTNDFFEELIDSEVIWKMQIDTYQRELERYEPSLIDLAENIFCVDSEFAVRAISLLDEEDGKEIRSLCAIKIVDSYLESLCSNILEKQNLLSTFKNSFAIEFNHDDSTKIQLDKQFRKYRKNIDDILNNRDVESVDITDLYNLFKERNVLISEKINNYFYKYNELQKKQPYYKLLSFIHMSLNRLFRTNQRKNEYVTYELLYRYYKSEIGKSKGRSKKNS